MPTPFAHRVKDRPVLGEELSLHDLELQSSFTGRVVVSINWEFIGAERASIVPRVVRGNRGCICTRTVDFAYSYESVAAYARCRVRV